MRIAVHEVSKGKKGHALPTTSLEIETGHARFVLAETELRPTVLGLIATGRMRPDSGRVTIDGTRNDRDLRRRMALVDAPEVSDPHPGVTLAAVVGEELMFAGLPATPLHARRWLEQIGFAELASQPIGTIKPSVRVRVMAELAVLRDDVEGFVLVSPDRHGGRPEGWWRIASEFADRGFAVLVIVGGSAAAVIEQLPEALETDYPSNATVPVRPLADITGSTTAIDAGQDEELLPPLDDERAPAEPERDETPPPDEHRVSSQAPAASSLNDPEATEPVAEPIEATTPDDVPSTSSGTDDTATDHPTETENGAER
ncbi:hypothetical protein RL72_00398 [Microbacterium azadirachtae]|uniref:ABC transporter ATP-binding protein n=1 Tax=Microbacterium azadirachtae TaxID=582680 RepID=A0A0F0L5Y1_9MICO|nr:hypothetical protein [Microbacterium azadirachtae]KJL28592.1 hypothetical protein RL72_00398 [Microbacterium azadirachtae]